VNKLFIFLLIAASLFVSFGTASKSTARTNQFALINSTPTPKPLVLLQWIDLDRKKVNYICPWSDACGKIQNMMVLVKPNISNPKKIPLTYEYKISGGKIIGQGEEVLWNLKGVRPGTYTITAAIDDGRGGSYQTKSETVEVEECGCELFCVCPTLSVSDSGNVKAGESLTYKANVIGGTAIDITYDWKVSQGEITEGQGTSEIKVKTSPGMTGTITATVEIGGDLCADCRRTASETATIIR
jgi:hypothetical protein